MQIYEQGMTLLNKSRGVKPWLLGYQPEFLIAAFNKFVDAANEFSEKGDKSSARISYYMSLMAIREYFELSYLSRKERDDAKKILFGVSKLYEKSYTL